MVKILSQAGLSLADIYDVKGSIAGIEQLETRELPIFHEMGGTVFSERFVCNIRRAATAALAQNVDYQILFSSDPRTITRVLGLIVLADVAGRLIRATVSIANQDSGFEVPIFAWDSTLSDEVSVRISDGAAAGNQIALVPSIIQTPNFITGRDQPEVQLGDRFVLRGTTSGFGAGTVTVVVILYLAVARLGGVSSYGLPIPSW